MTKREGMLIQADAARIPLPDQSVHTVCTSPPYWGLRRYSGDQSRGEFPDLGLEPTPEKHIERIVTICREVRRVLRDDGVFWLNYGDCYAGGGRGASGGEKQRTNAGSLATAPSYKDIPEGNAMLMPHRIALALQADGWIVRKDLVWEKPNPMPESVAGWRWERERKKTRQLRGQTEGRYLTETGNHGDAGSLGNEPWAEYEYGQNYRLRRGSWRHTSAHEYVFMLVKQMNYYCNQEAVREAHVSGDGRGGFSNKATSKWAANVGPDGKPLTSQVNASPSPAGRNPRSVLKVPTSPYSGAHYATFPGDLIAPLIRASCPRRSCPECGAPWAPVVERGGGTVGRSWHSHEADSALGMSQYDPTTQSGGVGNAGKKKSDPYFVSVTGYRPTCGHDHEPIPGIVLDPFMGSGTTGMVAKELMRRWIGLDISMPYLDEQAKVRTGSGMPRSALEGLPLFGD